MTFKKGHRAWNKNKTFSAREGEITQEGWLWISVGMFFAILGCLLMPLPLTAGIMAFVGATAAIFAAIKFHEHK